MTERPRVIDLHAPQASGPFVCPACAADLNWVRRNDLTSNRVQCRCRQGHIVHTVRCRSCAALISLRDSETGLAVIGLTKGIDLRARDDLGARIEDELDRDR